MKITFSDGVTFGTAGPYRIEQRADGLYVVGEGMLCPVASYEEDRAVNASLDRPARKQQRRERA